MVTFAETVAYPSPIYALATIVLSYVAWRVLVYHPSKLDGDGLPIFPAWTLIEGHAVSEFIGAGGWLRSVISKLRRYRGSLYGMTSTHIILYGKGRERLSKDILRKPHSVIHNEPAQWHLTSRVFGADPTKRRSLFESFDEMTVVVSKALIHESTVRGILEKTFEMVRDGASRLVTLDDGPGMPWEMSAQRKLISSAGSPEVEVDLFCLTRDFVANITISSLFGKDFLKDYPEALEDLWALDNAFAALALGVPTWTPVRFIQKAVSGRKRLIKHIGDLHAKLDAIVASPDPAAALEQSPLADVSPLIRGRGDIMRKYNLDHDLKGSFDLAMLWAMNGNTNNLIFWFLSYIYSTPSLLASLRNEIDPHVHLSASAAAPISSFTWEPLVNSSPLLKGAYFETFRLAHEPMSIRYLAAPVTLTDPTTAQPTSLAAGTFLTVPHNILQRDAALFPDPGTFQPERFIETSTDEASGVVGRVARYGEFLKPWGDGQGMCRGRVFAEREVLTIVACVIKAWDVSPAEKNGTWKLPGKKTGTGVCLPDRDMRVRVRRRVMAGV